MPPKVAHTPRPQRPPVYETVKEAWDDGVLGDVDVLDSREVFVGSFALAFLESAGANVMTIGYLVKACRFVLEIPEDFDLVLADEDGPLPEERVISAGQLHLNGTFPLKPGPEGKSRLRQFLDSESAETISASSRSTINQSKFREALIQRDQVCPITGSGDLSALVGCHIVPHSLGQEKVDEICKANNKVGSFTTQNGLLLRSDIHKLFDRFEFGLYGHEGVYYVHAFTRTDVAQYHGQVVRFDSHGGKFKIPHGKLLEWHYAQCMAARFRGKMVPSEFQLSLGMQGT